MRETMTALLDRFDEVADTHSEEEMSRLAGSRKYAHDLIIAIGRGQRRKRDAAFAEAERWMAKELEPLIGPVDPTRLFWHTLGCVTDRALAAGISVPQVISALRRQLELLEKNHDPVEFRG